MIENRITESEAVRRAALAFPGCHIEIVGEEGLQEFVIYTDHYLDEDALPEPGPEILEHPEIEAAKADFFLANQIAWELATQCDEATDRRDKRILGAQHDEALAKMTAAQKHLQEVRARHREASS